MKDLNKAVADGSLEADEYLLLAAYRSCNQRHKTAVRLFCARLSSLDSSQITDLTNVISLNRYRQG